MKMASIDIGGKVPDWFWKSVIVTVVAAGVIAIFSTAVTDHERIQDHDLRITSVEKRVDAMSDVPSRITRVETEIHQNTIATNTLTEAILTGKVHRPKVNQVKGDDDGQ